MKFRVYSTVRCFYCNKTIEDSCGKQILFDSEKEALDYAESKGWYFNEKILLS